MRFITIIALMFSSVLVFTQDGKFYLPLEFDTILINNFDTAFTYQDRVSTYSYDSGIVEFHVAYASYDGDFNAYVKLDDIDSINGFPVGEVVYHGPAYATQFNGQDFQKGSFYHGKKVGVWYEKYAGFNDYEFYQVFDSSGNELPLVRYEVDTNLNEMRKYEIDTVSHQYHQKSKTSLITDWGSYFIGCDSDSCRDFEECQYLYYELNEIMQKLGYESWDKVNYDFIRIMGYYYENPYFLSVKRQGGKLICHKIISGNEVRFDFENILSKDSCTRTNLKLFTKLEKILNDMDFWANPYAQDCSAIENIFIEAKIGNHYNSRRFHIVEWTTVPQNKALRKMLKKLKRKVD